MIESVRSLIRSVSMRYSTDQLAAYDDYIERRELLLLSLVFFLLLLLLLFIIVVFFDS